MIILYAGKYNSHFSHSLIHELVRRDIKVEYCAIEPTSFLFRAMKTIRLGFATRVYCQLLVHNCKRLLSRKRYDRIFVHNVSNTYVEIYRYMRKMQPHATFVAYNWIPHLYREFDKCVDYFDVFFTFDRKDAHEIRNLKYYPLYYDSVFLTDSRPKNKQYHYDIVYIGSSNSPGRMDLLEALYDWMLEKGISFYLHLYTPLHVLLLWIKKAKYRKLLKYCKPVQMNHEGIADIYSESRCVLDLLPELQTGNTMRTYEALAAGCKILSNNPYLLKEPFYIAERCLVFQDVRGISPEFIMTPFDGDEFEVGQYSFSNWVTKTVLIGTEAQ